MVQPIAKFKEKGIEVTVWQNTGQHGIFHNIRIQRSYLLNDGNWENKSLSGLNNTTSPILRTLLQKAEAFIEELREQNNDTQTEFNN